MIDFVRCHFDDKEAIDKVILNGLGLDCEVSVYHSYKGGITYRLKYHNLVFVSSPHQSYFEGSLHAFYNALSGVGAMNYTHFSVNELVDTLDHLEDVLGCDFRYSRLVVCEFGFNLELQEDVNKLLDNHILMYKLKAPCFDPKNRPEMKMKKFEYDNYTLKIYNKGLQYMLDKDILRMEIKCKTDELNKLNIKSLGDLRRASSIEALFGDFMERFQYIQIVDCYKGCASMSKNEQQLMIMYTNPNYWIELRGQKKYSIVTQSKEDFNRLQEIYNLDSKRKLLLSLITNQYNILKIRYSPNVLYGIANNINTKAI